MVEPVKHDTNPEQPTQEPSGSAAGRKIGATPAAEGAKPTTPNPRRSGLMGKLFAALVLLLATLGAAGYAALIFRDKDERVKVAADYIESELDEAQSFIDTAPKRLAALLNGKKIESPNPSPSSEAAQPSVASAEPTTTSDKPVTEPAATNEKPAAAAPDEKAESPELQKSADQPTAPEPEKPEATVPSAAKESPGQTLPGAASETSQIVEAPKAVDSAAQPATTEVRTVSPASDDLTTTDLVYALEGRIEALSEEVRSLREKLDQPKNETRAAPVAGGSSSEAATVVIAFALQKELDAGRPYADEIAALTRTGADPVVLGVLTTMAETGAPTGARLHEIFKPLAKKIRAEEPTGEQDLASHLIHGASKLVRVRPTGTEQPETLDGALAKIDAALTHDNFVAAAAAFATLPEWARSQAGAFAQMLDKRLAIARAADDLLHGAIAGLGGVKK